MDQASAGTSRDSHIKTHHFHTLGKHRLRVPQNMHSRQFLERQTKFIDSLLAELSNLDLGDVVNFNNTKQFDTLLRYLEMSLEAPEFCSVPSQNILHILLTLACRCPAANWSNDSLHNFAGDTTEYMLQVNMDYDNALYKASLQQRSVAVLERYLDFLRGEADSLPIDTLRKNVRGVLLCAHSADIASQFFGQRRPFLKRITKGTEPPPRLREPDLSQAFAVASAVEVISDSEDSDGIVEAADLAENAMSLPPLQVSQKHVASFSDLGLKTSGLGETATLFKSMPHLSASGSPADSAGEESPHAKKPRNLLPDWKRIQVFDDHVILRKVSTDASYDLWSLLKWAFLCADTSSQYQTFLFDSGSTNVHSVYRCTTDFLRLFFGFCHADLVAKVAENKPKRAVIAQLLAQLGPRKECHDRLVQHVFSGLGVPSANKSRPCYPREAMLTTGDSLVSNSRCKTTCVNDDNMDSMALRVRILALAFHYDLALVSTPSLGLSGMMGHVKRKLAAIPFRYLQSFLVRAQRELVAGSGADFGAAVIRTLDAEIAAALLCELTGVPFVLKVFEGLPFALQVAALLSDERLYRSLVDDETFASMEDFQASWKKVIYVAEWLFCRSLESLMKSHFPGPAGDQVAEVGVILQCAQKADELALAGFKEYLENRYEDSDLLVDSTFTLTREEIEKWGPQGTCSFAFLAEFKLGVKLKDLGPGPFVLPEAPAPVVHDVELIC